MNLINQAMLYLLELFHQLANNYGLAIILLTLAIRLLLWPLNSAQTRSMKKMQALQPKLKELQDKHKDNPAKMQEALQKFYTENSFNPLAGCLPMLLQIPIFIGLYSAVSSPAFLAKAADEQFLFIDNLSHTLQSHAGPSLDQKFNIREKDTFSVSNPVKLVYDNGTTAEKDAKDTRKFLEVPEQPPGYPLTIKLNFDALDLAPQYLTHVRSVEALVVNDKSREIERLTFESQKGVFQNQIPTVEGKDALNLDVFILILIYGIFTWLYTRLMNPSTPAGDSAQQPPGMKYMPLIFVVMLFFMPIPAGVMLYLVATTVLMFIQTLWVNMLEDRKEPKNNRPANQIIDIKPDQG